MPTPPSRRTNRAACLAGVLGIGLLTSACNPTGTLNQGPSAQLTIKSAECVAGSCFVNVTLSATGKKPVYVFGWIGLDSRDRNYAPDPDDPSVPSTGTVNPGLSATTLLSFTVPNGTLITELRAHTDQGDANATVHPRLDSTSDDQPTYAPPADDLPPDQVRVSPPEDPAAVQQSPAATTSPAQRQTAAPPDVVGGFG
jgi:hypothetical protein